MNDKALRAALRQSAIEQFSPEQAGQAPMRLPSNFAHTTLQRIRREQKARERREQIIAACVVGLVALLGCSALLYYYGGALAGGILAMTRYSGSVDMLSALLFCTAFLTVLNMILRRRFA